MVFVSLTLLEEEATIVVKNEDGECSVQPSLCMCTELLGGAERLIVLSNQHDGNGLSHDLNGLRETDERYYGDNQYAGSQYFLLPLARHITALFQVHHFKCTAPRGI